MPLNPKDESSEDSDEGDTDDEVSDSDEKNDEVHEDERPLESLAWERGSSMYNSLIVAKPSLGAEINRLGLLAEPMPSLDAIALQQNITAGSLQPLPALQKHETSSDKHASTSPKKVISDPAGVLLERNSFTSPVKEHLILLALTVNGQQL
ncbi:Retinoblastoma-related protein [Nymphaea thermarum]|nr:Retinoblastoma-related protein [Nymphaea thermarum]